jgi:hypothetical protein
VIMIKEVQHFCLMSLRVEDLFFMMKT